MYYNPRVAIIYPLDKNTEGGLEEALNGIRNLRYPKEMMGIFIISGQMTDEEKNLAKNIEKKLSLFSKRDMPETKIFSFLAGNTAEKFNVGVKFTTAKEYEYILFHGGGGSLSPDALSQMLLVFDQNKKAGIVQPVIRFIRDGKERRIFGLDFNYLGFPEKKTFPEVKIRKSEEIPAILPEIFLLRAEDMRKYGGMDEDMDSDISGLEISWRFRAAGHSIVNAPSALFNLHRPREKDIDLMTLEHDRYRLLLSNFNWPTTLLMLPAMICSELYFWPAGVKKILLGQASYGFFRVFFSGRRHSLTKRRIFMRKIKKVSDRYLLSFAGDSLRLFSGKTSAFGRLVNSFLWLYRKFVLNILIWW